MPFDDLPWQFDPVDGVVVTANNAAVDGKYPHFVAQEWDPGYRAVATAIEGATVATLTLTPQASRPVRRSASR